MSQSKHSFSIRAVLTTIITLIAISAAVILIPFFLNVTGGISSNPTDWGSFGSYFGGTLATVVSMISLIAVIYTVYLQRQILDSTQNFSATTIEQQSKLISSSEMFNQYSLVENHRQRTVRYIENQVTYVTSEINRIADSMNALSFTPLSSWRPEDKERLMNQLVSERIKMEKKLQQLNGNMLMLSVNKFDSVEEIDAIFASIIKDFMVLHLPEPES
ncbi:hypothetical protein [Rheinheimera sp.]|uniref:hypothetical protein n=1 Tax=Rheinheimera sp. TaxID=1869214 RepID=UPI002353C02B|nr:hypothetical protein [Rheinheimera sp.]